MAVVVVVAPVPVVVARRAAPVHDRPGRLGRLARSTPLRWIAAAVVVAAVVAAWMGTRHTSPGYRTATATAAPVSQTVSGVGTLQPLAEDDLAFATAGTVATVGVTVGEQVGVGQDVASLSTAPLQQAVDDAQATLAAAQARLAADEAAQAGTSSTNTTPATSATAAAASDTTHAPTAMLAAFTPGRGSGGSGGSTPGGAGGSGGSTPGGAGGSGGSGRSTSVATAQAALVAAQHALDLAEATESTDLQAATTTCNDALASGSSTPASACTAALATVTADHRAVGTALAAVATAESALADAIAAAQHATTTTTTTPPVTPSTGSGSTNRTAPSTSPGSSGTPTSTVSPQQVAVDQASVDQAQAQLTSAQTDLADATLASPIAGTVASVGLEPGQAVQAGSTSGTIIVIGQGTYQATVDVPVASIASVATGQKAVVVPDATDRPLSGTVSSIGALPVSSSGSTDYPVTVALGSAGLPLGSGGSAQVTITVRTAAATVTVPTSAIHTFGSRHLVDRLVGGSVVTTVVGVGVVGPTRTQITSGLSDGSQVVLADLNAPLPVSNTSTPGLARAIAGGGRFGPAGG